MTGTLQLTSVSAVRYQGGLSVVATNADGTSARLTGTVTGRLVAGTTVDFTVLIGSTPYTHIGSWRGDTVSGRWLVVESGGVIARGGRFDAVRR